MTFRVTPQQFVNNTVRFSQLRNRSLLKLQQQVSTGLRIQKPSDDPAQMVSLIANKANVTRIDTHLANINIAKSKLNLSVFNLTQVRDELSVVLTVAQSGVQSEERETLAAQVQGAIEQLLQIANAADGGNPLYGGTSGDLDPFNVSETDIEGRATKIEYNGSNDRSTIVVGAITVDALYSGAEVFGSDGRGETVFIGDTGVTTGAGTDSASGRGELVISHIDTEFDGTSGLAPGLSHGQDTLIGTRQLTVDAEAGTLSIGHSHTKFEPGDRDVRVVGSYGEVFHVDTTNFNGVSGTYEVIGHGVMSIDGGASSIEVDFSENQIIKNSLTGEVTNVNTTKLGVSGVEQIEYSGTSGLFEALINLRDDLLNTRELSESEYQAVMQRNLGEIQRVHDHVLNVVSQQSSSLANLESLQTRSEDYQLESRVQISEVESVDIATAIIDLQQEQNALQFTYAASAGILDLSILDFLR